MQKILLLLLITILTFSCNKSGFSIDATIKGVEDGRKVTLKKRGEKKIITIDTTTIKNGKFHFKGTIIEPTHFGIFIDKITKNNEGIFPLIDVNDHVTITAYKDSLHSSKINGSFLNEQLTKLRLDRESISVKAKTYAEEFKEAKKTKDTATIFRIRKIHTSIQNEIAANEWKFIRQNPNSLVAAMALNSLLRDPSYKDSIQVAFDAFPKEIQNATVTKPIRDYFDFLAKQKALEVTAPKKEEAKK